MGIRSFAAELLPTALQGRPRVPAAVSPPSSEVNTFDGLTAKLGHLPKGELKHRGKLVDPKAIKDTPLLAIVGERDDISGIGQTKAALDLATALPGAKKQYLMAKDVGHYGIFNGRKWRERIAPVVEKFIASNS